MIIYKIYFHHIYPYTNLVLPNSAQFIHFHEYRPGLSSTPDRKSMEPSALQTHGDLGRVDLPMAPRFFLKRSPCSLETMGEIHRRKLAGLVSHGGAMLTLDARGQIHPAAYGHFKVGTDTQFDVDTIGVTPKPSALVFDRCT
ncbi:MAG: hypothetical protein LBP92_04470 [Deltaproteobacteria bacterium]|nr:hypothetical protein [Deltaproteobacteria bacterium]